MASCDSHSIVGYDDNAEITSSPTFYLSTLHSSPTHAKVLQVLRQKLTRHRDNIHQGILSKLELSADQLSLTQVLEAATWKGGREIAAEKRVGGGREL